MRSAAFLEPLAPDSRRQGSRLGRLLGLRRTAAPSPAAAVRVRADDTAATMERSERLLRYLDRFVADARFEPHRRFANGHAMTLAARFTRIQRFAPRDLDAPRLFDVCDGLTLLARCGWQRARMEHPTLLLVHGVGGSCYSHYMVGTAAKAYAAGFNVVRLNQRGSRGTSRIAPVPYHAGHTADIVRVIERLVEEERLPWIGIVGFSLGGNQVLKLLGEIGSASPEALALAAVVSVPLDLERVSHDIHRGANRVYERAFLYRLQQAYWQCHRADPRRFPRPPVRSWSSIRAFDELVAAPFHGFSSVEHYYTEASCGPHLARIRLPTVIVQARDDPFISFAPFHATPMSPTTRLLATERGGHLAFLSSARHEDPRWLENRLVELFHGASALM